MSIITRQHTDEDYITWFYDKNNKVVGYVEEGRLFAMRHGYAEHIKGLYFDLADARKLIEIAYIPEPRNSSGGKPDNTVALIGFMAAKLACYEPDSPTVKQALEWLECRK